MSDLPVRYRQGAIARLKARVRHHENRLTEALEHLEDTVVERLPPARLRRQIRQDPYKAVALCFLTGLLAGALLRRR